MVEVSPSGGVNKKRELLMLVKYIHVETVVDDLMQFKRSNSS